MAYPEACGWFEQHIGREIVNGNGSGAHGGYCKSRACNPIQEIAPLNPTSRTKHFCVCGIPLIHVEPPFKPVSLRVGR
jgi:hypothetical protein